MKKAILGSLAVLPLVASGVLANAGAANALSGGFQLTSFTTLADITEDSIDFFDEPNEVLITSQTGDFEDFNGATINDITSIGDDMVNNPFLDLGTFGNLTSLTDGDNVFNVTDVNAWFGSRRWFLSPDPHRQKDQGLRPVKSQQLSIDG